MQRGMVTQRALCDMKTCRVTSSWSELTVVSAVTRLVRKRCFAACHARHALLSDVIILDPTCRLSATYDRCGTDACWCCMQMQGLSCLETSSEYSKINTCDALKVTWSQVWRIGIILTESSAM